MSITDRLSNLANLLGEEDSGHVLDEMEAVGLGGISAWIDFYLKDVAKDAEKARGELVRLKSAGVTDPETLSALDTAMKGIMGASSVLDWARGIIMMAKHGKRGKSRVNSLAGQIKKKIPWAMTQFK